MKNNFFIIVSLILAHSGIVSLMGSSLDNAINAILQNKECDAEELKDWFDQHDTSLPKLLYSAHENELTENQKLERDNYSYEWYIRETPSLGILQQTLNQIRLILHSKMPFRLEMPEDNYLFHIILPNVSDDHKRILLQQVPISDSELLLTYYLLERKEALKYAWRKVKQKFNLKKPPRNIEMKVFKNKND